MNSRCDRATLLELGRPGGRSRGALKIGSHIDRYVVLSVLGEGATGSVYLAEHSELKTRHAIKVLLPHLSRHPQIVQRFRNEARAAAATRSPNIVAVRDFAQLETGSWYLVMDYWEGTTLAAFMAKRGPLSHAFIVRTAIDALNGLAAAHARSIIHRDLKPDNLYLADIDGDVRTMILDFGVCRLGEDGGGVGTRTGAVIGTPRYMPPEQFRAQPLDHRADLWALGATLYEMATGGWVPHDDEDAPSGQVLDDATRSARMAQPPVDPRRRTPSIPSALGDALLALLAVDPTRRPPSAAAAAVLLAETLPSTGHEPDGIELLQRRAPDLLRGRTPRMAVRAASPQLVQELPSHRGYVVRARIGSGPIAEVFRADHGAEGVARPVALKRVLPELSQLPAFAAAFTDEARLASHLNHPNCASVLAFERDEQGRLFMASEYVAGKDLAAVLHAGRLAPPVAIFVITKLLRGLDYAHTLANPISGSGLVHRGLSPGNVLLSWEGAVKISDFGMTRALAAGHGTRIAGKPGYMSPEQLRGEPLDARSDLFAVGILLWEALTGARLFKAEGKEASGRIVRDPPRPRTVRSDLPADLEAVVMKLLARDPRARHASAEQAIEDLARCNDSPRHGRRELIALLGARFPAEAKTRPHGLTVTDELLAPHDTVPMPAARPTTLDSAASQSAPRPPAPSHRRRRLLGALLATLVSVVTFIIVATADRSPRPASSPPSMMTRELVDVPATSPAATTPTPPATPTPTPPPAPPRMEPPPVAAPTDASPAEPAAAAAQGASAALQAPSAGAPGANAGR